ncbi:hypothetical protein [Paraburkholderia sp. BL6669N2]|uniref:hypothetical protein n=1 Tax=Paraburkholderia sp. BL6669N2 TaxID=1938807 RepID=UPI000E283021|nr:hypothetical protein [Paraburkholderia sp. BL6669N2]
MRNAEPADGNDDEATVAIRESRKLSAQLRQYYVRDLGVYENPDERMADYGNRFFSETRIYKVTLMFDRCLRMARWTWHTEECSGARHAANSRPVESAFS